MPVTLRTATYPTTWWPTDAAILPDRLLKDSCPNENGLICETNIFPPSNGFVRAAYSAYRNHYHLTIRPEDVWISILSQDFFVEHAEKKELENVVDPDLRAWIMPDFSTTTNADIVTAAIPMMGIMQNYFSYNWIEILHRLELFPRLGTEPELFTSLLAPILDYFIHESGSSGPVYLSGWITAFCFWTAEGKYLYKLLRHDGPERFEGRYSSCDLDSTLFHSVHTNDIPGSFVSILVTVNYNRIEVTSSGEFIKPKRARRNSAQTEEVKETDLDSIQPVSGWWVYELVENKK
ncbi:hypothetical protein F4804DRAFT_347189 [Jackrogersella minutella]|nr:hypothetical protein F4804DRAFT_347189 [Jackrogersella minutella]